jgi:hypothetical protein
MSDEFRNVRNTPVPLASGRVLAPGDASPVSDDPHDQALITDGALLPVETGKTTKKES